MKKTRHDSISESRTELNQYHRWRSDFVALNSPNHHPAKPRNSVKIDSQVSYFKYRHVYHFRRTTKATKYARMYLREQVSSNWEGLFNFFVCIVFHWTAKSSVDSTLLKILLYKILRWNTSRLIREIGISPILGFLCPVFILFY